MNHRTSMRNFTVKPFYQLIIFRSVRGLEAQISDLEAETGRLSRAFEQQRTSSAEIEAFANKKVEEFSRELQKKVNFPVISLGFLIVTPLVDIRC